MNDPQNARETIPGSPASTWQQPAFEVICLACELSAYAPDDGGPLF